MSFEGMDFETRAVHVGSAPDPATGAVIAPIYQTSTYVQEALGKHKGYEYARTQNPTRAALEENMAVLEGGAGARAFASGMAAITAVSTFVKAGEHVVCSDMTYGGTHRYYTKIQARSGVEFSFVDTSDAEIVRQAFRGNTRLLHLESPTNPTLEVLDIAEIAKIAQAKEELTAADEFIGKLRYSSPEQLTKSASSPRSWSSSTPATRCWSRRRTASSSRSTCCSSSSSAASLRSISGCA